MKLFKTYDIKPFESKIYLCYNLTANECLKKLSKSWKVETLQQLADCAYKVYNGEISGFTIYGECGNSIIFLPENTSINTIAHELHHAISYTLTTVGEPIDSECGAYIFGEFVETFIEDIMQVKF